jgi:hypothetical protein
LRASDPASVLQKKSQPGQSSDEFAPRLDVCKVLKPPHGAVIPQTFFHCHWVIVTFVFAVFYGCTPKPMIQYF